MTKTWIACCAAVALVLASCSAPEASSEADSERGAASAALRSLNGRSFNGRSFNGRSFNGRSFNGVSLDGIKATGVQLEGQPVNDLSLSATVFSGVVGGTSIAGAGLVGSIWEGMLSDGTTLPLRLDAVEPLPPSNDDLLGYVLSYQTDEGWVPFCGEEPDSSQVLAIPMAGLWNYGVNVPGAGGYDDGAAGFTFACRHFAIAKCVEMGYRPWATADGHPLKPATVACTRLLRADYCGTGESHTVDGTLLDLYDRYGIQVVTEPSWSAEAEWTEAGAACIAPGSGARFVAAASMPACYPALESATCGTDFGGESNGTLLIDRHAAPTLEAFSGVFEGSASGSLGYDQVWLTLLQTGSLVTGSYVADDGSTGTIQGVVDGPALELVISSVGQDGCLGSLTGSATLDGTGEVLSLAAEGTSCDGAASLSAGLAKL